MIGKLIYVFNENDRDALVDQGYQLLKSSDVKADKIYVFANNEELKFNNNEVEYVTSDVLTF